MTMLTTLLRLVSYLFHLPIALFFFALGCFALLQGVDLNLDMLPWSGSRLTWWIFGLSLFGLLSLALAILRKVRFLFGIYSLIVFGLVVYGVFLSRYRFDGSAGFRNGILLCLLALVAALGAILPSRRER